MPLKTIINNIPKIDFFTVFPAGFFVLIVLALIVRAETDNSDLWFQIDAMALLVKDNPVELIIIGFSSYLFGNLLRAFPVKYAEALLPGSDKFPYSKGLKTSLEELELNAHEINLDKSKLPDLTNEVTPNESEIFCQHVLFRHYRCNRKSWNISYRILMGKELS